MIKMASENRYKQVIKNEMAKLTKNVKIWIFTSLRTNPDGSKVRECQECNEFMNLLTIYESHSNGKLTIEEHSIYDNPEFAKRYDVERVPTILFIDNDGKEYIRYLAAPRGPEVQPFVQAIFAFAGAPNYYEATIKSNLNRIKPSTLKIMITNQCPYCPQVVNTANLFSIASEGKIRTVVVDIMANPDIGQYYNASGVPYTIINEQPAISGMVGANEILRKLIGGNVRVQY
ncbi:MAG: hypothetical protein GF383_03095 [Candidatus Lokiarchaeota archaeon]|nr:hypothetical protein [Candidatus Lokiarchaeota archaeon]MBD3338526.1 hypothetical protein [Candidatus Lokiarchaeota archaeon]